MLNYNIEMSNARILPGDLVSAMAQVWESSSPVGYKTYHFNSLFSVRITGVCISTHVHHEGMRYIVIMSHGVLYAELMWAWEIETSSVLQCNTA